MIVGIDYGSKTAGTTVLAVYTDKVTPLRFVHSLAGTNADELILSVLSELEPSQVFIDAPLSLPHVYKDVPGYDDFFYRVADREVKAMSPMFLGGLTARAMSIRKDIELAGHTITEVYPSGLARELGLLDLGYKKSNRNLLKVGNVVANHFKIKVDATKLDDWHHVDALLCAIIGLRILSSEARCYGSKEEGQIWV